MQMTKRGANQGVVAVRISFPQYFIINGAFGVSWVFVSSWVLFQSVNTPQKGTVQLKCYLNEFIQPFLLHQAGRKQPKYGGRCRQVQGGWDENLKESGQSRRRVTIIQSIVHIWILRLRSQPARLLSGEAQVCTYLQLTPKLHTIICQTKVKLT